MMGHDGYQCLRVEARDGVAWVTIDHPPINLFDMALIMEMLRVGEELEKLGPTIVDEPLPDKRRGGKQPEPPKGWLARLQERAEEIRRQADRKK